jgi:quinol monooxygenase YgiN
MKPRNQDYVALSEVDAPYDPGVCVIWDEYTGKQVLEQLLTIPHINEWCQSSKESLAEKAIKFLLTDS